MGVEKRAQRPGGEQGDIAVGDDHRALEVRDRPEPALHSVAGAVLLLLDGLQHLAVQLGRDRFNGGGDLVALMAVGVDTGAIHTIRPDHDHGDLPRRGADRPRNYVYQRDGWDCRVCGTEIALQTMEARTLFWCPTCQPGRRKRA